ncbi:MAG: hypothetical protein IJD82_02095, partial [Clostridia bacterium]|nr:hypothetical protein [Clostridia bacterium]
GDVGKAAELSETLPSIIGFNQEAALGRINECNNNYAIAVEHYTANIAQFQRQLVHSLVLCGNMHARLNEKKKAIEKYASVITFAEAYLKYNPTPDNHSLQKTLAKSIEDCKKKIKCLSE